MALLEIITIGIVGGILHKSRKEEQKKKAEEEFRKSFQCQFADDMSENDEEENRTSTSCEFSDDISECEFGLMVCKAARPIKRLESIYTDGPIVYGTVKSQSKLSTWTFQIDFNDYGHITGSYWITSDNDDSNIPLYIANNVRALILSYPECRGELFKYAPQNENTQTDEDALKQEDSVEIKQEDPIEVEREKTKQAEEKTKRKKMELEYQAKQEANNTRAVIGMVLLMIVLLGVFFYIGEKENIDHKRNKDIQVSTAAENLENKNFKDVKDILSSAGFKNIKLIEDKDLILGVFSKNGEVEKVTINGNSEFSANEWFPVDAKVKITYHTYK